jgi:hypothetical protein
MVARYVRRDPVVAFAVAFVRRQIVVEITPKAGTILRLRTYLFRFEQILSSGRATSTRAFGELDPNRQEAVPHDRR